LEALLHDLERVHGNQAAVTAEVRKLVDGLSAPGML
jgi:hypothetical protein